MADILLLYTGSCCHILAREPWDRLIHGSGPVRGSLLRRGVSLLLDREWESVHGLVHLARRVEGVAAPVTIEDKHSFVLGVKLIAWEGGI